MKRRLLPIAAVGLAAVFGAWLLRDLVRETIVAPLAYLLAFTRRLLDTLPQDAVWIAFLGLCLVLIAAGLFRPRPAARPVRFADPLRRGRVEKWLRWLDLAIGGNNAYARHIVAQRLAEVMIGALADRNAQTPDQVRQQIDHGDVDLPDPIRAKLRTLLDEEGARRATNADLEDVLRYLEDQLEAPRDG